VIKTYVELGLGVGIVASVAFDAVRDQALVKVDTADLFEPNTTRLGVRRGSFLRSYTTEFIRLFAPGVTEGDLKAVFEPATA
jgi:DNA-binding transcriptional LysR family regulator